MIRKIVLSLFAATGAFAIGQVTNQTLANMANHTIKCRNTSGTGSPEDCTATQVTAFLNAMVGDSGSGGVKGLVGAPGSGDHAAGKYWDAGGGWSVPASTASPISLLTSKYSSGTTTWNPGSSKCVEVKGAGGGGGGGGGGVGSAGSQGGTGGGGSACQLMICVTNQSYTISVGAGGAKGSAGGGTGSTAGSNGGDTTITDAGSHVVYRCNGGIGAPAGAGNTDVNRWYVNQGGYGGIPTCNVNLSIAGAAGLSGGIPSLAATPSAGSGGAGTGDTGGVCGGGGGGAGMLGNGGTGGGGGCVAGSTGGNGGGGGGGGASGHPSVCSGAAGGDGGPGEIEIYGI